MFCGGGGISEGLKQAGFSIVFGLDSSKPAVETFAQNHPDAKVVKASIEDFSIDDIPEFDILVGGPPCVEFSASKQGRGDILAGLELVQAFLRVVHYRKPKYWIMENVPRIVMHLPERIPLSWIGVNEPGDLSIPIRNHFNTADYGVPQARERFLMGNFPVPSPTHYDPKENDLFGFVEEKKPWVTLSKVLESLPSPLKAKPTLDVKDLNYDINLPIDLLSDHFHEVELPKEEERRIRKAKEAHPFMGWMPFPDAINRPARTVVATQLGRETLVLGEKIEETNRYRRATVRECAIIQGYPITYQFFGPSLSARYRVVGNGVPPILTYNIGKEIRRDAQLLPLNAPCVNKVPSKLSPSIPLLTKRKQYSYKLDRKFSDLVPGKEVRGCLVELSNQGNDPVNAQLYSEKDLHIVHWVCRLTIGEGKAKMTKTDVSLTDALKIIRPMLYSREQASILLNMMEVVFNEITPMLSDASTLQAAWIKKVNNVSTPEDVVDNLSEIIDNYFPANAWAKKYVDKTPEFEFLPNKGLRVRLAVGILTTAFCTEVINRGVSWVQINESVRYVNPDWVYDDHAVHIDIDTICSSIRAALRHFSDQDRPGEFLDYIEGLPIDSENLGVGVV